MPNADPRITESGATRDRPHLPDPKKRSRATTLILAAVAVAAVLLLGGTYLFAPQKVYDPGESYGTQTPPDHPAPAR